MSDSDDISNHQTPKTSFRVHNLFELTCSETPIANNLIQRSISKTSAKLITSRRRSNLFQNENRIIIEDTPSPVLNRKKNLTGKKKHRSSSSKPRTPVLRLPPSVSSHSSGSKKIKKLLTKEANLNEKAIETSPVNSQTTPGRKISSIFKPKSKQDDDDDNENLGSNLSFNSLKKLERRRNNLVVRLSEIFSNIEIEDTDSNKENQNANKNNHFEINPSPIVIQQRSNYSNAFYDNFESTKIASNSTLTHKTTNTHSLTHVTNDNDETSRFEYTILNSNGRLHINSEKQFVVLATQYIPESKPQLVITDDETETDISSSITKQTSLTSNKNKSDKLSDKTNSFNNNNNNLIKSNKSKSNINRYSYCSEDLIQIDEVDIPVDNSNNKSDSDDDYNNYSFKKSKRPDQKNTSKNRTKFGSTQSPVVISNKSGFVSKITCTNESNETRTSSNSNTTTTTTTPPPQSIEIPHEKIINNQPDTTVNKKAKKPLLNVDKFLNDDDVLPGNSNDKNDMPKKKYSSIFKPKKSLTNLPPTLPPPATVTTATTSNRQIDIQNLNSLLVSSMSSCSIEDENCSQERNNNSIVLNLNQEDLEFILDSQGNEQQRVVSRTSSKFSSTRNGSIVEKTTTTTTTKVTKSTAAPVATTSKEVVRAQPKPLVKKQARTNKNNQILLSHFDLNSLVDSLNSTFTLTTENKYNVVFKIGEEIADHVCQLNDKQFFDKTKILCLIKELISNDVNFIPSVLNPRLKFTTIQNNESSTNTSTDSSNSSNSSSSTDDSNDLNECNTCLQKNKLLTEVCISCRLYYHKKCEKIKYIPKNGWICSKCKTKKT